MAGFSEDHSQKGIEEEIMAMAGSKREKAKAAKKSKKKAAKPAKKKAAKKKKK